MKETLGPYTEKESTFNPLVLITRLLSRYHCIPKEKIKVVFFSRKPCDLFYSWVKALDGKGLSDFLVRRMFELSCSSSAEIVSQAVRQGIQVTHFVYEITEKHDAYRRLFARLGILHEPVLQGWDALPAFGAPGSNIYRLNQPKQYCVTDVHDKAMAAEFRFSEGHGDLLSESDYQFAAQFDGLYADWYTRTVEDLGY